MYQMTERGTTGGIAGVSRRFAASNNSSIPGYDPSKPTSWIVYLDENNSSAWTMSIYIPVGGFEWVRKFLTEEQIMFRRLAAREGYIFEVVL